MRWGGSRRGATLCALVLCLAVLAGCGDETDGPVVIDRLEPACAESLIVESWCLPDDSLNVRMTGMGAPSSCYRFEGVDIRLDGRAYTLLPMTHLHRRTGDLCLDQITEFDTTLVFQLPDTGIWWFRAPACGGDSLVASTRVVQEAVFPAFLDFLWVPPWCEMAEGIAVELLGNGGTLEDYRVDRVEIEQSERMYTLRPFVRDVLRGKDAPPMNSAAFDTTLVLYPATNGPWWITVIAANGTFVDSTKVK